MGSAVEATAPASLELVGARSAPGEGRAALYLAVDRRVSCRVETGWTGLLVESKDAPYRFELPHRAALAGTDCPAVVSRVLESLGIEAGLRVTLQSRCPPGSGWDGAAVAVTLAAATLAALGRKAGPEAVRDGVLAAGGHSAAEVRAAMEGGLVASRLRSDSPGPERLAIDPGRVDECLLIVDCREAAAAGQGEPTDALPEPALPAGSSAELARALGEALASHRYEAVAGLLAVVGEPGRGHGGSRAAEVAAIAREAGGAATSCAPGATFMLVWASPGARGDGNREAAEKALRAAGFRTLEARVDLRGLEVD